MMMPYYQEDGITIYHGDCRDILPHLEPVDLVLTSPPYDNLREYGGHDFNYTEVIDALYPKIDRICVWIVGDSVVDGSETGNSFRQALYFINKGLNLHDTMIYWKNSFAFPESTRYAQVFEYMFIFSRGTPSLVNISRVATNRENRIKTKSSCYRRKDGTTEKMNTLS